MQVLLDLCVCRNSTLCSWFKKGSIAQPCGPIDIPACHIKIQLQSFHFRYDSSWWRHWWRQNRNAIYLIFRIGFSNLQVDQLMIIFYYHNICSKPDIFFKFDQKVSKASLGLWWPSPGRSVQVTLVLMNITLEDPASKIRGDFSNIMFVVNAWLLSIGSIFVLCRMF